MARVFTVTAALNSLVLDRHGRGEIAFTVSNASAKRVRGRAMLVPQAPSQKDWLTLSGASERDFPVGGVQQFTAQVAVPATGQEGNYTFRLDAFSVHNPDEDYTQGPTIAFSVVRKQEAKRFPWWIVAVSGALLVIGVAAIYILGRSVKVPDVVGSDVATAGQTLQKAKLLAEEASRVLSQGKSQDAVLSQDPKAGQKVRSGSAIKLVVADAGTEVPDVLGYALKGAIGALQRANLQVDEKTRSKPNQPAGIVVDQDPKPGELVKLGTVVSIGVNDLVKVPTLVGTNLEDAKNAVKQVKLVVGEVKTLTKDEGVTGTVASQSPYPETWVAPATAVALEVVEVRPKPLGCDGVAGSGKVLDDCGVCGGGNACLRPCPARTVAFDNQRVSIDLDLPQTAVDKSISWSDVGVHAFIFGSLPLCKRVAISNLKYSCNRTAEGGKWVESGQVTRDNVCFSTGNFNQPYLRIRK